MRPSNGFGPYSYATEMSTTSLNDEDERRGFHERDPATVAADGALGPDGAAQVESLQYFYRDIFESRGCREGIAADHPQREGNQVRM